MDIQSSFAHEGRQRHSSPMELMNGGYHQPLLNKTRDGCKQMTERATVADSLILISRCHTQQWKRKHGWKRRNNTEEEQERQTFTGVDLKFDRNPCEQAISKSTHLLGQYNIVYFSSHLHFLSPTKCQPALFQWLFHCWQQTVNVRIVQLKQSPD